MMMRQGGPPARGTQATRALPHGGELRSDRWSGASVVLLLRRYWVVAAISLVAQLGCRDRANQPPPALPENRLTAHLGPRLEEGLLDSARGEVRHARSRFASTDTQPSRVVSIAQCDAALDCVNSPNHCATYPPLVINALATLDAATGIGLLSVNSVNLRRDTSELRVDCSPRVGRVIAIRQRRNLVEKNEGIYWGYHVFYRAVQEDELDSASERADHTIEVPPEAPVPLPLDILDHCCATVVDRTGRIGNFVPITYRPVGAQVSPPTSGDKEPAAQERDQPGEG